MLDHAWMRKALHDLSQPLTALECRLALEMMDGGAKDDATACASLKEAIAEAHAQCERVMDHVRAMQNRLHAAQ